MRKKIAKSKQNTEITKLFKKHQNLKLLLIILGVVIIGLILINTRFNKSSTSNLESLTPTSNSNLLCNFTFTTPQGYTKQDPINSFYGIALKDGQGEICVVLLGPNYKPLYEGFSGEQIQINVYDKSKTNVQELMNAINEPIKVVTTNNMTRYSYQSYGGVDEVYLIEKDNVIYQIIWRNEDSNIDIVTQGLATELTSSN